MTIEGVKTGEAFSVKTADISLRRDWQVRGKLNERTIRDYKLAYISGAKFPPLEVADIDGALILVDGWHRITALKQLDEEYAHVIVVSTEINDARIRAAKANLANGLPLTRSDKRRVFEVYIETGQHRIGKKGLKSYRQIRDDLIGIASKSTIEYWMKKSHPKIAARMASARDFSSGGAPYSAPSDAPYAVASRRLRDAIGQAIAEARGIKCPVARLGLAVELEKAAKAIAAARPASTQTDENTDF